jgi:hypothetical protein
MGGELSALPLFPDQEAGQPGFCMTVIGFYEKKTGTTDLQLSEETSPK